MTAPQTRRKTKLVDRLTMGEFVNGYAPVMLDGEPVGELHRTPSFIWATVLGEPYGGGKNYKNALRAVSVGYQKITGNWEA